MANRFRCKRFAAPARCQHQGCLVGSILDDHRSSPGNCSVDDSGCLGRNSAAHDIFARQGSTVFMQPVLIGVWPNVDRRSAVVDDGLELIQDDAEQRSQLERGADRL